jgi:hypothetical protein
VREVVRRAQPLPDLLEHGADGAQRLGHGGYRRWETLSAVLIAECTSC